MKRTALSMVAAAAILLSFTACSSKTNQSGTSDSSAPGPSALKEAKGTTDINVWYAYGGANGKAFQSLIDNFNKTNKDNIHATATFQGTYTDLLAKYTAGLRSNSAPDVLVVNDVSSGYIVDAGQVASAANMSAANPGDIDLTKIPPAGKNYYTIAGIQQAVPMGISTPVLWVNRNLLRKAGIPDNADFSTFDAVVSAAKSVHQKTGKFGYTMQDDDWTIENWTSTGGQDFCTPDNGRKGQAPTAVTINTGAVKDTLTKLVDLYRTGVAVDGAVDGSAAINAFQAGDVAFMPYGSGLLGLLKKGTSFTFEALPFPASDAQFKGNTIVGGGALWLGKSGSAAQQIAGWKLEAYLTSAANQEIWSHATGYLPANTDVKSMASQQAFLSANPNFGVFVKQVDEAPVKTSTAGCVTGAMTAIRASNINELQAAFAGTKSVDDALNAAAASAKTLLEQYKSQRG